MLPEAHVDLGAQHARAVGKFAGAHPAEQVEVFLHAALAERAVFARLGQGAAVGADRVLALVVHIGQAGADEVFRPAVQPLEIVGGVVKVLPPIEAEPAHVALDGVDIFLLFLGRIGVVETQMTAAAEFLGDAEIQADRLGVADMQIAVRLGRKAGDHLLDAPASRSACTMSRMKSRPGSAGAGLPLALSPVAMLPRFQVRLYDAAPNRPAAYAMTCHSAQCQLR